MRALNLLSSGMISSGNKGTGRGMVAGLLFATAVSMLTMALPVAAGEFDDSGWRVYHQENFDTPFEASDGQTFGSGNWLVFQLIDGGAITVASGYARLNAPDFWNAALIRSTHSLPSEYKVRTRIGYINYDLTNYESSDYSDPRFDNHDGYHENGMYFLTLTDDTCVGDQCAEEWWHYHRKMVIDIDNHLDYGTTDTTVHPVFMVYMSPELNEGGNVLCTWNGALWDTSPWNWNVAYTYEYATWYYAELEKRDGTITLRLYDADRNVLEETTPVDIDLVFAMDDPDEFLYVGEPHTDDYEGDVRIDEITLLIPDDAPCCEGRVGDANGSGDDEPTLGDIGVLIQAMFLSGSPDPISCMAEADVNQSGGPSPTFDDISLGDISILISYLFINGPYDAVNNPDGIVLPDCL